MMTNTFDPSFPSNQLQKYCIRASSNIVKYFQTASNVIKIANNPVRNDSDKWSKRNIAFAGLQTSSNIFKRHQTRIILLEMILTNDPDKQGKNIG